MFHSRSIKIIVAISILIFSLKPNQVQGDALSVPKGQNGIVVESPTAIVDFGKTITFTAKIKASIPIQQISLLFRGVNEEVTRVETLQLMPDGSVVFKYDASLNIFPPFSYVVFWFQATLSDGITYTSDPIQFQYKDDRFPWRQITRANVTINWYAGDDAFGAAALDAAGAGMLTMKDFIPISLTDPIEIYIYSNPSDLQATLLLGGQNWAGGHAHPELGVVLASIAPGANQFVEMETLIPHELTHVMMYRALGEKYNQQPIWLLEGIASSMEIYANPEYARALKIAGDNDTLIPFADLCASFPR